MPVDPASFEARYAAEGDHWDFSGSAYEQRRYDLTMAMLPERRYRHGVEPACATGELTARLATRCDQVSAFDGSATAVAMAARRLTGVVNVELSTASLPQHWPDARAHLRVPVEPGAGHAGSNGDRLKGDRLASAVEFADSVGCVDHGVVMTVALAGSGKSQGLSGWVAWTRACWSWMATAARPESGTSWSLLTLREWERGQGQPALSSRSGLKGNRHASLARRPISMSTTMRCRVVGSRLPPGRSCGGHGPALSSPRRFGLCFDLSSGGTSEGGGTSMKCDER